MSISTQITELNNNINDLKSIKQDIKKAINTDFNVITNEKLEDYADIIKNTFETYKDYIPFTETEQATEITVNDAMEYTKNKIKLFGNTEQNQYQGYNILNGISDLNFASNYNANRSTTTDTITVTSTSTGQYACARAKFSGIENGETYSISIKATFDTNGLPRIRLGKNDFEVSHIIATPTATLNGNHYESSYTFTAEEDFDLAFSFYPSYSGSNTTTHTATFYDIMIEKGSTVHNYEPYVGGQYSPNSDYPQQTHVVKGHNEFKIANASDTEFQILELDLPEGMEMCNIDTYQDNFVKQDGKWYKQSKIVKLTLTTWEKLGTTNFYYKSAIDMTNIKVGNGNIKPKMMCNMYKVVTPNNVYHINGDIQQGISSVNTGIIVRDINVSDLDDFEDLVENIVVYCVYDTPVLEEITDTTLISQLNALERIFTYSPQTNITVTSADLKPIMKLSYKKIEDNE